MDDTAVLIGVITSAVTTIISVLTVTKWMLDAKVDGLDRRLTNLENGQNLIIQHLLGTKTTP